MGRALGHSDTNSDHHRTPRTGAIIRFRARPSDEQPLNLPFFVLGTYVTVVLAVECAIDCPRLLTILPIPEVAPRRDVGVVRAAADRRRARPVGIRQSRSTGAPAGRARRYACEPAWHRVAPALVRRRQSDCPRVGTTRLSPTQSCAASSSENKTDHPNRRRWAVIPRRETREPPASDRTASSRIAP